MRRRVAVVGLDALHWRYFRKLLDAGIMPFTKSLVSRGFKTTLDCFPPYTPPSWSSIMTGVNPGKHGIMGFVYFDRERLERRLISAMDLEHPRIHEMLAMNGCKSIVLNPIPSFPIIPVGGIRVISNLFFTPKTVYYPENMKRYVEMLPADEEFRETLKSCAKFSEKAVKFVEGYLSATEEILNHEEWDMFWLNFNLPDHMLHKCDFRFFRDVIHVEREVFAVIDKVIRKLRSESDALIIVSDHGFSEYRAAISVNDVLMKEGYIKLTGREAKALSDHSVLEKHGAMRKDIAWIRLPLPLLKLVSKPVILPTVRKLRDIFFKLTGKFIRLGFNVDLLNSRAFLESHSSFGVSVKDATDVDKVKELLSRVDGIEWVKRREELYSGPYLNRSNELLVKPKFDEGYTLAAINIYGSTHIYGRYTGHHPDGVLVVDSDIPDKRLVDGIDRLENYVVAPLVMWLMDQPLPSDTDALPMLKKITGEENFRFRADYVSKWRLIKRLAAMRSKIRS